MHKPESAPVNDPCKGMYHEALYGEKEQIGGVLALGLGSVSMVVGIPMSIVGFLNSAFESGKDNPSYLAEGITGSLLGGIGFFAVIGGIVALADGSSRIETWNDSCTADRGEWRYCLQYLDGRNDASRY